MAPWVALGAGVAGLLAAGVFVGIGVPYGQAEGIPWWENDFIVDAIVFACMAGGW